MAEIKSQIIKTNTFNVCDGTGIIEVKNVVTEYKNGEINIASYYGDEYQSTRETSSANSKIVKVK